MEKMPRMWLYPLAVLIALTLLSACAQTSGYKKPIEVFQKSLEDSSAVIAGYYNDINQAERDFYIDKRLYDPTIKVSFPQNSQGYIIFEGTFVSTKAIKARLDAIDLLGKYGRRLAELAGSDAPTRFESEATALGDNLKSLKTTFTELVGEKDTQAEKYTGPIGTVVGVLGRMYMEHQRDQALTSAIKEGAPAVENLLKVIEDDLNGIVSKLRETGAQGTLTRITIYYDKHKDGMTFMERAIILSKINEAAKKLDAIRAYKPAELVQGIRMAHQALVKYAVSDRKPQNLAELAAVMDDVGARIKQISDVYRQLRGL